MYLCTEPLLIVYGFHLFVEMRVLAVDYGRKRCGVAVTDVLKIAANSLPVVPTAQLLPFLIDYCGREPVERIIVGEPRTVRGEESDSMRYIRPFLGQLRKALPEIPVEMVDERFTSVIAHREMIADRRRKGLADEMSAVLILTTWLESN